MNKKKLHLQGLALAVMLAASSLAMAAPPPSQGPGAVTLTNTSGDVWSAAIGNIVGPTNSFIDVFSFSPPATPGSSVTSALVNANFQGFYGAVTFTSVDLNGTLLTLSTDPTYSPTILNLATLPAMAITGPMVLTVKGSSATGGSYGGNVTLLMSPVAEPETYAMMISGLGLIAMLSRRRKS